MSKDYRISILTPTYNRLEMLKKNCSSVMEQNLINIQHVIIDNCSSDGTEDYILQYQEDANYLVTYIREMDTGIYNAMNKGIRNSLGEWIMFLNSDDQLYSQNVLTSIIHQLDDDIDIFCGHIVWGREITSGKIIKSYYDEKNQYHAFQHQGTVIKKEIFNRFGLYNERLRIVSDGLFNAKYYRYCNWKIIDFPIAFMNSDGLSGSNNTIRSKFEYAWVMSHRKFPVKVKIEYWCDLIYLIYKETRKKIREKVR